MEILYSHRTRSADGQYVHIDALTRSLMSQGHGLTFCGPEGFQRGQLKETKKLDADAGTSSGLLSKLPRALYELAELAYSVPAWQRLKQVSKMSVPDIIYERYNLFFLAGLWMKQKINKPLLLEVNAPLKKERETHGGLALGELARWAERKVWHGADAILPVTQVLANMLVAEGVDPAKIHVIPNGIDQQYLDFYDPSPIQKKYGLQGKTVLGFTGFVRDWHGVDLILDYMAARQDQNLHLLLVGDGPHVPALEAQAQRQGLASQFTVTGVVQREDIPAHIAAFDIALQPRATAYASPLKLFEYMALGKAILAPSQANICEVLSNGDNAVLFEPDSHEALARKLDIMCTDQVLRDRLGAAARQTIIDRDMTWDGNARKVITIAEDLLGQS